MAAIMLLAVIVLGGVGAFLSVRATKAAIAARIDGVAQILEQSNFPLTDAVLRQMGSLSGAEMVVVDDRGRVISTSGIQPDMTRIVTSGSHRDSSSFELADRQWMPHDGFLHTTVPLNKRAGRDDAATLHIFYPEADYRSAWWRALVPSLAFVIIATPAVMLLAGTTASRISRRMSRLQGQVDRIAHGDFQQLTLGDRDDEIRALGQAVNRMAVMLARYEDDVRRTERMRTLAHVGGGIAHQLRNSATGCAIALDLHAEECPIASDCESLDVAKRQLRLMEEYIQRFLQLGKTGAIVTNEPIDLVALIDELLPLIQPAARHASIHVDWQRSDAHLVINGDRAALSQLLINLFVNAVEAAEQGAVHNAQHACVAIRLTRSASNEVTLTVSDSGTGPPNEIGEELFEPFVTAKTDGVGLGLSVAREVAVRHGGRIGWTRDSGMTTFTVVLPYKKLELQCA
jgi:signal transduction histidine kinase